MQEIYCDSNLKPSFDAELEALATYTATEQVFSDLAYQTARLCLQDALGCASLALNYPECTKLLGPYFPETQVSLGARVPGTAYQLDPMQAAFNIGALIRWLDFNDTWLASEWGHPSDNLGAILALADYQAQKERRAQKEPLKMRSVLRAMIKAYEIQGILALENSFNKLGLDHVMLVKIASTAVSAALMGADRQGILNALSQAWVDGQSLRTYRHAPNTGSRKSWAAADATARAVFLALLTERGERGYPSALSAKTWGFQDSLLRGQTLKRTRPYQSYVIENILFKVTFPAEFHAQTAVECAVKLHQSFKKRLQEIDRIELYTQEPALRIISKSGPLHNPADRDHCIQYMVAVALLEGTLKAEFYEEAFAAQPEIDALRAKIHIQEYPPFSKDYLDPEKRSIGNSLQIFFNNGEATEKVTVEYPLGHQRRREEAIPFLSEKFKANLKNQYTPEKIEELSALFNNPERFDELAVDEFMGLWVR